MCWKKMPSWARGGVIGVIIVIILFVILFTFINISNVCTRKGHNSTICTIEPIILSPVVIVLFSLIPIPLLLIIDYLVGGNHYYYFLFIITWEIVVYFLIGSIIGFIIGKIKNRGKKR